MNARSPRYPTLPLADAIEGARKIHKQDRRYAIDREVAMKHMGYSPMSGSANKAIASLIQYELLEKSNKGQVQLTLDAENIILGDDVSAKSVALAKCAFAPALFSGLRERFKEGTPSSEALRSHLIREGFTDAALAPAINAYLETLAFLEQEDALESPALGAEKNATESESDHNGSKYGGASVGDFVQWEANGVLKLAQPTKVVSVHQSGDWVFVEGSQTGIPMSEVIVEQPAGAVQNPPVLSTTLPMTNRGASLGAPSITLISEKSENEKEWVRTPLGKGAHARILVTEDLTDAQIDKLCAVLSAMKEN